ncbi:hypothetical protein JD509_17055, partial [Aeromonas veronii]|nr:hypothetical protein [Aeromonas veronii]
MIAKFESKEGGEFRHPVLTQKVKEHKDTQNFINSVTKQVQRYIKDKDGNIDGEPLANWMSSYKEKIKIPVFNSRRNVIDSPSSPFPDAFGGLAMAINDVWGARAEIIKFQRYGNYYMYGDGIHLTVAHKREWSYGFKPDNKTVPLPCYLESPYDHQRE